MFAEPDLWLYFFRVCFLLFTCLCTCLGLTFLFLVLLGTARIVISRFYGIGALFEAARELQRQGKAPRLTRWLNYGRRHGIDS